MRDSGYWIAFLIVTSAASARAGGLFAGTSGSQGMQRAGAFVVKADDPTAIYFNPAGIAKARRFELYLGSNVVSFAQSFDRAGVYEPHDVSSYDPAKSCASQVGTTQQPGYVCAEYPRVEDKSLPLPVPFFAATQQLGRLAIAEGVFGFQGFPNRAYPATVATPGANDAPAPQRYDIVEQEGLIALPSIAAAYSVREDLDVGARMSWGFGHVKARTFVWGVPNPEESVGNDGDFHLDVADYAIFNYAAGVLYRPRSWLELGASFTGPISMHGTGTGTSALGSGLGDPFTGEPEVILPVDDAAAKCERGGTADAQRACMDLALPMTAAAGGRWIFRDAGGRERADLEIDLVWENWSATKDTTILVDGIGRISNKKLQKTVVRHGFEDVYAVRMGGEYRIDVAGRPLALRGGVAYDSAAAPVSWTRLDIDGTDRFTGAAGIAYDLGSVRVDLGGAYIYSPPRDIVDVPLANPSVVAGHVQPDPILPTEKPGNQEYSPINAGHLESHYVVATVGLTTRW